MTYYRYLNAHRVWTTPPTGTTLAQLIATYREVRQCDTRRRVPLAWWRDGIGMSLDLSRKIADLRRHGFTVTNDRRCARLRPRSVHG
jgi:hypothetical protein